jgi:hypothetical protein
MVLALSMARTFKNNWYKRSAAKPVANMGCLDTPPATIYKSIVYLFLHTAATMVPAGMARTLLGTVEASLML